GPPLHARHARRAPYLQPGGHVLSERIQALGVGPLGLSILPWVTLLHAPGTLEGPDGPSDVDASCARQIVQHQASHLGDVVRLRDVLRAVVDHAAVRAAGRRTAADSAALL